MEETLTDCLVRGREDLNNLKRVRDYLDAHAGKGNCSVTWRTIEAFNSILGVCSSQHTPQSSALDTLLDSFYHLARNNVDPNVWNDFGFELGIICAKVLSAIERSEIFEILFCKLLVIIKVICEHNTKVWKASARQILNIFINKKFSLSYFERIIKLYLCILRNIESFALLNFSSQNLHLLKTLSKLVQKVGDFEVQSDIMELVFLHLLNNKQSMSDFFAAPEKKLFESLEFSDFEADCRIYLNALNKPRGTFERKVYSVCCHVLYLGGCFVEPPVGTNSLWVDANKGTERLSIRCADLESEGNRVIYILFSDILSVQLANDKTEGNRCLTLQTKSLSGLQFDVKNDDICLMIENGETLFEFVNFLKDRIRIKRKLGRKVSKTKESLLIDRNSANRLTKVQDNAVTSSEKPRIDHILPDILNLFERANHATINDTEVQNKTSQNSRILSTEIRTPSQSQNIILGSQELSPNSFVESLNQHIGRNSPENSRTFEDSVETIEFWQKRVSGGSHKLFRSSEKIFDGIEAEEPNNFNFVFVEEKENNPVIETAKPKPPDNSPDLRILRDRKNLEQKLTSTQSQDYFQHGANILRKRKPSLPKLKRCSTTKNQKREIRESKEKNKQDKKRAGFDVGLGKSPKKNERQTQHEKEAGNKGKLKKLETDSQEKQEKLKENQRKSAAQNAKSRRRMKQKMPKSELNNTNKKKPEVLKKRPPKHKEFEQERKPSLLDPNGYAYRRWCEPTTSERSNFWLKKLNAMQKLKSDSDNVFNFSEESDSVSEKSRRKKLRIVHSKRRYRTKEMKQFSLKQVKEILRKTSTKEKQSVSHKKIVDSEKRRPEVLSELPEPLPDKPCEAEPQQSTRAWEKNSTVLGFHQNNSKESNSASDFSNEDYNRPARIKKRERSIEENSLIKTHIKKKSKISLSSGKFRSALQCRLLKREKEDKQQTGEIISTVNKAVNHVFNHLQRKEGRKIASYLSAAEEAVAAVEIDVTSLSLRAKRIQRAMLYFQAGCSISDLCESTESQFSSLRSALGFLDEKKDFSRMIIRVSERLMDLIKSEIERSVDNEFMARRNRLLRCASIFNQCGGFN